jgi:Family of unknown function (DUF6588)
MQKGVSAVLLVLALAGFASAQDLSGTLGKVGSQYAQAYVTPAANAFGVDLNSGLFHTAKVGGMLPFGLNLYVGVKAGAAFIPSSDQTFSMSYVDTVTFSRMIGSTAYDIKVPATFTVNNAPTIFGDKNTTGQATFNVQKDTTVSVGSASQTFALDSSATFPTVAGLLKTSIAPIPIPQLGLGSIFGTDIFIRYLPKIKLGNYGSVQLLGYGLRHSVSQYLPLFPVDIAVQLGWQKFTISDSTGSNIIKASAFAANVEVSKTFAILTLYGGLQVESSSVDVNYNFIPPPTSVNPTPQAIPITFSVKGKNNFRALVGLTLGLGPLTINADYNMGAVNAASAGIGITI